MPYLGSAPATSFQTLSKQDFSTSATTSYTLSSSVTSANEIALFINNVRQEPTTAYSASGTALTLSEATSSSDDMYCIYLGKSVGTINPPSGSVGVGELSATGTKNSTTFLRGDNSFAEAGGGKLLQLVNVFDDQRATYSSTNTDNDVQVMTASITPSASTSKILLLGGFSCSSSSSSTQYFGVRILRGSTEIGKGDKSSWQSGIGESHQGARGSDGYSKQTTVVPVHFLDTPNTTSATTYNIRMFANHYGSSLSSATLYMNSGGYNYNNKEAYMSTSQLTLMEIGA